MKQPILLLSAALAGYGQDLPDARTVIAYQAEAGVSPPSPISQASPRYSEEASKAKFEAIVKLSMAIGLDGRTAAIKIVQGAGLGLDENAVEAVRGWLFRPGMKDGQPQRVAAYVEVNYRLRFRRLLRREYKTAAASPPVATLGMLPFAGKSCGLTTLSLHIGTDGLTSGVRVLRTTPKSINDQLIEVIKLWRFKPARLNGLPVDAEVDVDCEPWAVPQ